MEVDVFDELLRAVHLRRFECLPPILDGIEGRIHDHTVGVQVRIAGAAGIVPKRRADEIARQSFALRPSFSHPRPGELFQFSHGIANRLVMNRDNPVILHETDHRDTLRWTDREVEKHAAIRNFPAVLQALLVMS